MPSVVLSVGLTDTRAYAADRVKHCGGETVLR